MAPRGGHARIGGHPCHSNGLALDRPLTRLHATDSPDSPSWHDGRVAATYVHLLFEPSEATTAILKSAHVKVVVA